MRGDVDEIVVELDHVLEAGIDRGKCVFQVLERLGRLSSEVARRAGELAGGITPGLTGDVDSATGAGHLNYMGVAWRRGYGRRIDEAQVGRGCALGERWCGGAGISRRGDYARQEVTARCGTSVRPRRAERRQGFIYHDVSSFDSGLLRLYGYLLQNSWI